MIEPTGRMALWIVVAILLCALCALYVAVRWWCPHNQVPEHLPPSTKTKRNRRKKNALQRKRSGEDAPALYDNAADENCSECKAHRDGDVSSALTGRVAVNRDPEVEVKQQEPGCSSDKWARLMCRGAIKRSLVRRSTTTLEQSL